MNIEEIVYENQKYYYINEYKFKYGIFYKFANQQNVIFCTKEDNKFKVLVDKKILKKLKKNFQK